MDVTDHAPANRVSAGKRSEVVDPDCRHAKHANARRLSEPHLANEPSTRKKSGQLENAFALHPTTHREKRRRPLQLRFDWTVRSYPLSVRSAARARSSLLFMRATANCDLHSPLGSVHRGLRPGARPARSVADLSVGIASRSRVVVRWRSIRFRLFLDSVASDDSATSAAARHQGRLRRLGPLEREWQRARRRRAQQPFQDRPRYPTRRPRTEGS